VIDLDRVRQRVTDACARAGLPDYPWWIPTVMNGLALLSGSVAVVQRFGEPALPLVAALMAVALSPWLMEVTGRVLPWPVHAVVTGLAAGAVVVVDPIDYDFAMFVLVMLTGHLGAVARPAAGLLVTAVLAAGVKVAEVSGGLDGSAFWMLALLVSWDVGFVMQYQQRRLTAQRQSLADHEAQAVLEERQRIAREVHDVIAHSLSVTMLHLTAARRSLEEGGEVEVDEAVDALRDAERLGRQAMTDIRHTVGLLGQAPGSTTSAAPGVDDVGALVDQFRGAGLDVELQQHGDTDGLSSSTGLGVYRIVQESLANIAKHQPRARAAVHLDVSDQGLHLTVHNEVASGAVVHPGGSGLAGMRQRADLLGARFSAGPHDNGWLVELTLPGADRSSARSVACPLPGRRTSVGTA
jgi:signal transduction histidine kinase